MSVQPGDGCAIACEAREKRPGAQVPKYHRLNGLGLVSTPPPPGCQFKPPAGRVNNDICKGAREGYCNFATSSLVCPAWRYSTRMLDILNPSFSGRLELCALLCVLRYSCHGLRLSRRSAQLHQNVETAVDSCAKHLLVDAAHLPKGR